MCRHLLNKEGGLLRELLFGGDVVSDVAKLLLHHADRLEVGGLVEGVAAQQQQLDEVAGDVSARDVETSRQMRQSEPFVDGADVRHAVAGVDDDTGQEALCVKRQNSLQFKINVSE